MKKLFSFLCLLMLGAGMVVQAQLLDAVNDSPEGGYLFDENGQVSGRHNAPMATYEQSFTWNELYSITNPSGGSNWTRCNMIWSRGGSSSGRPLLRLVFVVRDADHLTINNMYAPQYGTYTFSSSQPTFNTCYNAWTDYESLFYPDNSKTYYLETGTVTVSEGNGGKPYIVVETTQNVNSSGNPVTQGTYITAKFTIGSPKQYSITVNKSPSVGGTVTGGGTFNSGTTTTIVATPDFANGYTFVKWQKDNADFDGNTATSITLTASAETEGTYTAIFSAATAGTIITTPNNPAYGEATGGGDYAATQEITITATANDGYIFLGWDSNNDGISDIAESSYTFHVNGDATYTALFTAGANIQMDFGVLNYSGSSYFIVSGSDDDWDVYIRFDDAITGGTHTYSNLNTANSYIRKKGGSDVTLTNIATTAYYTGNNSEVVTLNGTYMGSDGKGYIVEITTNYTQGSASFGTLDDGREDYLYPTFTHQYFDAGASTSSFWVEEQTFYGYNIDNGVTSGDFVQENAVSMFAYDFIPMGNDIYHYFRSAFLFFTDLTKDGKIPSGRYYVNGTKKPGTVYVGGYGSEYWRNTWCYFKHNEWGNNSTNCYIIRGGYIDVVNVDENYHVTCHLLSDSRDFTSSPYNITPTIDAEINSETGSAPFTVNVSATAGGDVDVQLHVSNWSSDVHYGTGSLSFYENQSLTLTAVPSSAAYVR